VDTNLQALLDAEGDWKTTNIGQDMVEHFGTDMSDSEIARWTNGIEGKIESANNW
jgi:hypothetical protein